MFVKGIMKPAHQCWVASMETPLNEIIDRLNENDILGMPVVNKGVFKGMISKELIYKAYFDSGADKETFLKESKVAELMAYEDLYITESDVFEKTLTTVKGFPIVAVIDENRKFLGIVTRYDILEQFESAFGMKKKGVRIAFTSEESEGRIVRLSEIVKQYHENIISLATFDETAKLARRIVLKIEKKDNIDKFAKKLERSGFRILDIKEDL